MKIFVKLLSRGQYSVQISRLIQKVTSLIWWVYQLELQIGVMLVPSLELQGNSIFSIYITTSALKLYDRAFSAWNYISGTYLKHSATTNHGFILLRKYTGNYQTNINYTLVLNHAVTIDSRNNSTTSKSGLHSLVSIGIKKSLKGTLLDEFDLFWSLVHLKRAKIKNFKFKWVITL